MIKEFIKDKKAFYFFADKQNENLQIERFKNQIAENFKDEFFNSLYIAYINFYIENEDDISCNFDLDCEPDYLFGHLANIELDENNEILMSGING